MKQNCFQGKPSRGVPSCSDQEASGTKRESEVRLCNSAKTLMMCSLTKINRIRTYAPLLKVPLIRGGEAHTGFIPLILWGVKNMENTAFFRPNGRYLLSLRKSYRILTIGLFIFRIARRIRKSKVFQPEIKTLVSNYA